MSSEPTTIHLNQARVIDAQQLAEILNLSVRTVRRLDSSGKLPRPLRIGGAVRWSLEEISAWIAAGCPDRQKWENTRGQRTKATR